MISARPPNAAAGRPPPITLPNVVRSPATPSRPYQPEPVTRNPVSTSSMISSAPCSAQIPLSSSLKPGSGGTTPMLAGQASVIRQAICGAVRGERLRDRGGVVVGQDQGVGGRRAGHPLGVRQRERGHPGPRRGQQRVHMPVVATGELHHQPPAGERPGQPHRRHRRLGAGTDQPDLLHRGPRGDLLGKLDLGQGRGAERGAAGSRRGDGGHHLGMRVPEDHRAPGADQVHVPVAVGVGQVGAVAGRDEHRVTADRAERTDR